MCIFCFQELASDKVTFRK